MEKTYLVAGLLIMTIFVFGCIQFPDSNSGKTNETNETNITVQSPNQTINSSFLPNETEVPMPPQPCPYECCFSPGFISKQCSHSKQACEMGKCVWTTPIDAISDGMIWKWGAYCKDKETQLERANCVLGWQKDHMFYCGSDPNTGTPNKPFLEGYDDCDIDMQLNEMEPTSFPFSSVMYLKVRKGKLFGQHYTYATSYCAIARWNELECRVVSSKSRISENVYSGDYGLNYCGIARKSYVELLGLDCNEWKNKTWAAGPAYYWAEVLIDGEWKVVEQKPWKYGEGAEKEFKQFGNYVVLDW